MIETSVPSKNEESSKNIGWEKAIAILILTAVGIFLLSFFLISVTDSTSLNTPTPTLTAIRTKYLKQQTSSPTIASPTPQPITAKITHDVFILAGNDQYQEQLGYAKAGEKFSVLIPYYEGTNWHQILYHDKVAYVSANFCQLSEKIEKATPEPTIKPGLLPSNPIVVSAVQLSSDVKEDIVAAKNKYYLKYVQIYGEILETQAYRYRTYDGEANAYDFHNVVEYWLANNQIRARSTLIPIEISMKDVSIAHKRGETIEIIGYVSSMEETKIEIKHGIYVSK